MSVTMFGEGGSDQRKPAVTPESIDTVRKLIILDHLLTYDEKEVSLCISRIRVRSILYDHLN